MTTTEARLAAGVLDWRLEGFAMADHAELVAALRSELTLASDWQRIGAARPREIAPTNGDRLTRWSAPAASRAADDDARLAAAWGDALGPPPNAPSNFLRLEVGSFADARILQQMGLVASRRLVGVVRTHARRVEWQWPLRVGVAPGPRAAEWLAALQASHFHGRQYHATMVPADGDAQFELVVVDTATLPDPGEPLAGDHQFERVVRTAGSVVAVGGAAQSTEFHDHTMATLLERFEPAIAIVMPIDDMSWWMPTFRELSHDVPLDAAVVASNPGALVAGDPLALSATAVGHWAMWVATDMGAVELSEGLGTVEFRHEDEGSQVVHDRVERLRTRGVESVLRINLALAAAPDEALPDDGAQPPPAVAPAAAPAPPTPAATRRTMVTEFRVGDKVQRRVLPPSSLVELEVCIAVPKRGQIAAEGGILEPVTPGPTALLDVTVRSSVWAVQPPLQHVSLPTSNRGQPSTSAFFEFTTGVVGQLVEIEIIVSFQNRPLQAATLTAAVRAKPGFREKVRVVQHPLSSPPEPTHDTTPAAVMVDARSTSTFAPCVLSGPSVTEVARMLAAISQSASQVLGADDAPTSLADQRALDLLIQMATKGSELMLLVAPLGYGEAGAIDQLVGPLDPVTPLELVYSGPAPHPDAQVCGVHRASAPSEGEPCTLASVKRVCPYAFWGMYRRINRTVTLDRNTPPPSNAPLLIDDVLYGAANQADFGSQPGDRPSERLATAAQTLLGSQQAEPVTSWRAWRKEVDRRHPPLLVALAHTELENGTTSLLLGRRSYLRRADVSMKVVRPRDMPAPLVVLMACDSASADDPFGNLPGAFTARGAGAVIATLTKLIGRDGATASREILRAIADATAQQRSVGDAVLAARRELIANDVLLGLFLVNHGNLDMKVVA